MGANHVMFTDRIQAGNLLAQKIALKSNERVLVLGLARGGVAVAHAIGKKLSQPVDVLVIKKLSSPYEPEFAIGAVAPDGVYVIHGANAQRVGADEKYIQGVVTTLRAEIKRNMLTYRKGMGLLEVKDRTIILVDDGAATGASMEAAIVWAKRKKARKIIVALPVVSDSAAARLKPEVDEFVAGHIEGNLSSVGSFYSSFDQVDDETVIRLLRI
jgi:putative phosphoribosyl transferase